MTSLTIDDVMEVTSAGGKASLSFTVVGDPPVQERAKMAHKGPYVAHMYDPSKGEKRAFATKAREAMAAMGVPTVVTTGRYYFKDYTEVALEAVFFLPRPLNHYTGKGERKRVRDDAVDYPQRKDVDNLLKFVMDALQGILYSNDNCLTKVTIIKRFPCAGEAVGMALCFSGTSTE